MKTLKILSALSLVASPCVIGAQTPTPSAPPAPAVKREAAAAPARAVAARRVARVVDMKMRGVHHGMMMDAASMFLGHTGDLQLTDAQVTKLAAIARRAEARQKTAQARMESEMSKLRMRAESDGGRERTADGDYMPAMMMRMGMSDADRKAMHDDNREAFSVVTPDQLATAWELMMRHRH